MNADIKKITQKCHSERSEESHRVPSLTLRTSFGLRPQNDSNAIICENPCKSVAKIKILFLCLPVSFFLLISFACVPPPAKPPPAIEPVRPAPIVIDPFKSFLDEHLKKAVSLERQGEISGAVEEFKIALTIDPANEKAIVGLKRLLKTAEKEAEKHYQKGLSLKKSDPSKAGIEFLATLRIKPDYQSAIEELKRWHLFVAKSRLLAPSGESTEINSGN